MKSTWHLFGTMVSLVKEGYTYRDATLIITSSCLLECEGEKLCVIQCHCVVCGIELSSYMNYAGVLGVLVEIAKCRGD